MLAVLRLGSKSLLEFPIFLKNRPPNPPSVAENYRFVQIRMESVQYLIALGVFENHVSYRRLLYEVQNLRTHQGWSKDCDGQWTDAHGRILLPGGVHREDLQDRRLIAPLEETELV